MQKCQACLEQRALLLELTAARHARAYSFEGHEHG